MTMAMVDAMIGASITNVTFDKVTQVNMVVVTLLNCTSYTTSELRLDCQMSFYGSKKQNGRIGCFRYEGR